MINKSIWMDIKKKEYKKLENDIDVDVLIIGGGMTGISTAYHLIDSDLKVALVEKNELALGVTSKTTGKLTFLQEDIYSKLKKYHDVDTSIKYLDSQIDAIKIVTEIINKEKIDCNLEKVDSYIFSNDEKDNKKIDDEFNLLKEFDINVKKTDTLPSGDKVKNGCFVKDTYVFHPLKYLYKLAEICTNNNIPIYENTKIISIDKEEDLYICKTESNWIKAKYVVFAVHYPYFITPFLMPIKGHIEKSYIEAYKVKDNPLFSSISVSKPTISTRYITEKDTTYQLYLTNSHNTAVKDNENKNFKGLIDNKNITPDYIWSNKDIITNDLLPYIGKLKDNNMLIGTGYNTWGMTNGSLAGKIISDIIKNNPNEYIDLFDPHRKINKGTLINFPITLGSNILSFIKSKIIKQKFWYSPNVTFETRNGKKIAIYTDQNKKEHIVYNLCPHMKCSLLFNEVEKTWDCPCHGSRFDIKGNVITGPSTYSIKLDKK